MSTPKWKVTVHWTRFSLSFWWDDMYEEDYEVTVIPGTYGKGSVELRRQIEYLAQSDYFSCLFMDDTDEPYQVEIERI